MGHDNAVPQRIFSCVSYKFKRKIIAQQQLLKKEFSEVIEHLHIHQGAIIHAYIHIY